MVKCVAKAGTFPGPLTKTFTTHHFSWLFKVLPIKKLNILEAMRRWHGTSVAIIDARQRLCFLLYRHRESYCAQVNSTYLKLTCHDPNQFAYHIISKLAKKILP